MKNLMYSWVVLSSVQKFSHEIYHSDVVEMLKHTLLDFKKFAVQNFIFYEKTIIPWKELDVNDVHVKINSCQVFNSSRLLYKPLLIKVKRPRLKDLNV